MNTIVSNKYGARRTYSQLCQREFDSKAECARGEELHLMQRVGEIGMLEYQPRFVLNEKPKAVYTADFRYLEINTNKIIIEDVKGVMTEAARLRIIWLKQLMGIEVAVIKSERKYR